MSAHTPGPWRGQAGCVVATGDQRMVCEMAVSRDGDVTAANIHLIAAAPDLLAALEGLMPDRVGYGASLDRVALAVAYEVAATAIARARGGK